MQRLWVQAPEWSPAGRGTSHFKRGNKSAASCLWTQSAEPGPSLYVGTLNVSVPVKDTGFSLTGAVWAVQLFLLGTEPSRPLNDLLSQASLARWGHGGAGSLLGCGNDTFSCGFCESKAMVQRVC